MSGAGGLKRSGSTVGPTAQGGGVKRTKTECKSVLTTLTLARKAAPNPPQAPPRVTVLARKTVHASQFPIPVSAGRACDSKTILERAHEEEASSATNESQRRQKRGQARQAKHGALRNTLLEPGILEEASVSKAGLTGYRKIVAAFLVFSCLANLLVGATTLDAALVRFGGYLYLQGKGVATGLKGLAAVAYHMPCYQGKGELNLPRFQRSIKGMEENGAGPEPSAFGLAGRLLQFSDC